MWISIYTSLSPLGSFNPPVHIYVHIHLFFYYTKRFLLIPRRLEEKIEIELLFSPAEFVNLSFCPLVFCRAKKTLPLVEVLKSLWLPGKWRGFQRGGPAGVRQTGASLVWEPLAVSEFSGC